MTDVIGLPVGKMGGKTKSKTTYRVLKRGMLNCGETNLL